MQATGQWSEEWQAPAFDEYVLILKGSVTIEHSHGEPVKVNAGNAVFLAKGKHDKSISHYECYAALKSTL